ncbi:hypothetical protein IMCC3317_02520 [Kordia antarctica]|uniref:Uncharacterized protein n=1 Tax=Kordia antarctica TaxID=1218801 RepID=A0A7L4ZE66_9FLAO|nr:hypothetical protein [Kordia antarctica]QHI34907.1 hypothetical protein IMCC3317_02520 [Kordia antarctica]
MKIVIQVFLMVVFANSVFAQNPVIIEVKKKDRRVIERKKNNEKRNLFVNRHVDSLNNFKVTDSCVLPDFFTNSNFDQQYGGQFMQGIHGRISLRKFIIDKLTNYNLLLYVVKSKDKRIKKKYKGKAKRFYLDYSKIPFEQYSTFELVDMRLDELDNEQNAGIKNN